MDQCLHVVICHKNRLFGDSLSVALSNQFSFNGVVVEGSNAAAESLIDCRADVLLLDSRLELLIAVKMTEAVRTSNHHCRLLLLSSVSLERSFLEIASLGADGCVAEESPLRELADAIRTVSRGESYCSSQIANEMFSHMGRRDHRHEWARQLDNVRLTPREREILELIAFERLGNKQIARRLSISLYTVKNHVHNIIEKMGVEDRYEAADVAKKRRILVSV